MKRFLIVHADDFGLCEEITEGIIKAYRKGILTSTSVVVNGSYFEEGVDFLKDSGIDAGIHLTFVGGEKPVSGYIDGLVDEKGLFLKSYGDVIRRLISGSFDKKALQKELYGQIGILKDKIGEISHIDSHQHLHLLPPIRSVMIDAATEFKIKWIRTPHSRFSGISGIGLNILGLLLRRKLKKHHLSFADNFIGFEERGHLNKERLLALLKNLKGGITELMVHPGYDASFRYDWQYSWKDELDALVSDSAKDELKKSGIILTNFSEMK
ncbi:MAG: ChbG/HpnK family deacetylase [Deltaproteobacteria bacterium]|nr:ChbG/HpnK family deacetylase [Deltaproteobacteria bacterium]